MPAGELQFWEPRKAIIGATMVQHQRIMDETYAAIYTLVSLVAEHRELEGTDPRTRPVERVRLRPSRADHRPATRMGSIRQTMQLARIAAPCR